MMTEDGCRRPTPEHVAVEFAEDMVGVPDAFQRLWTPHRMVYIHGESKRRRQRRNAHCGAPVCPTDP